MILCHCRRVADAELAAALVAGATTTRSVARVTGAGTSCGGCARSVREWIEAALAPDPGRAPGAALAG